MVATSRRIACASVANCSFAMLSGSASRTATWAMEAADWRRSARRRASAAKPNINNTGASAASANKTVSGRSTCSGVEA